MEKDDEKVLEGLSAEGFRALGVAWRELEPDRKGAAVADEQQLVFAGFVVFSDPPKASAGAAIAALGAKGVGVKILSGDARRGPRRDAAENRTALHRSWSIPQGAASRFRRSLYQAGFLIRPGNCC